MPLTSALLVTYQCTMNNEYFDNTSDISLKLCSQLARGRGTLAVHAPPNARSAFHKKQQSESYLARATPSSTNLLTPPVKVTGMYADTCLIRAENSNMLEVPFRRVSVRIAPKASKNTHKRVVSRVHAPVVNTALPSRS